MFYLVNLITAAVVFKLPRHKNLLFHSTTMSLNALPCPYILTRVLLTITKFPVVASSSGRFLIAIALLVIAAGLLTEEDA